jgi:membrane associated rhomboid family serine protease
MIPLKDNIPARTYPVVNTLLIAANVVAFVVLLSFGPQAQQVVDVWGLVPADVYGQPDAFQLGTLVTSMFLHGGVAHIILNMLALYIFGDNVEDRMGHGLYLVFYLLCGVFAGGVHLALNSNSEIPTIGASGAVAGVLGAYLVWYPRARVLTLLPIFPFIWPLPALVFLGLWFVLQVLNTVLVVVYAEDAAAGVAWGAHAGGFVAGAAMVMVFGGKTGRS